MKLIAVRKAIVVKILMTSHYFFTTVDRFLISSETNLKD